MKLSNLFLILGLSSFNAFAWGPIGHKIVGEIAQMNLTPKAQIEIKKILPNTTLADVSTWADLIKNENQWQVSKPWHYVSIPDGGTYADAANKQVEGDIISAVSDFINIIKDSKSTNEKKAEAVKFLVHLVGDVHQPLHVGRLEDRGGNSVNVNFLGRAMNLHALWDSGLIDHQKLGVKEYANQLNRQKTIGNADIFSYTDIIREDMALRKQVYDIKDGSIGQEYFDKNVSALNSRLLLGGKRLAQVLNAVFK